MYIDAANKASDDKTKDVYFENTKRIKLRNNSIAENSDISQFKPHELSNYSYLYLFWILFA